MSKVENASLMVEKHGRTWDAMSNPRKYQSMLHGLTRQAFDTLWKENPAVVFANFSHIAYYDAEHVHACLIPLGFDVTCYDDGHGRQGFLAVDGEKALLCFRGTEASDIQDLLDDIKIFPTAYQGTVVHRGFLNAALSLWEPHAESAGIAADLKQLTHHKLYVTGHSLGAAMAVIAAMTHSFEQVVTFGEPRVGKDIQLFDGARDSKHVRFVNGKDIVTYIIPEMPGYAHHGIEKHIPLIDEHEFFIGNVLDHSIIHYAYKIHAGEAKL